MQSFAVTVRWSNIYRAWHCCGLVGLRYLGLRISCRPATILESESHEDLRAVSGLRELAAPRLTFRISIVEGRVKYPKEMSSEARDLISGLCTVNPSQRLGNISSGGQSGTALVKAHPFFKSIDWDALYHRKIQGPIIPKVKHAADSSNFDNYGSPRESKSEYTREMASRYDHEFKDF